MKTRKKRLEKHSPSARQKNKQIYAPKNDRCCGNCRVYSNEDAIGKGWCNHFEMETFCDMVCGDWGWLNTDDWGDGELFIN